MRTKAQLQLHAARTLDALRTTPERRLVEAPPLAGGPVVLWAKITSIVANAVKAKFADEEGNVDPKAEEFIVRLYATDNEGVTWSPTLSEASPKLKVDQYIQIVRMPACGMDRPAGWYMLAPPLALTCPPPP